MLEQGKSVKNITGYFHARSYYLIWLILQRDDHEILAETGKKRKERNTKSVVEGEILETEVLVPIQCKFQYRFCAFWYHTTGILWGLIRDLFVLI